MAAKNGRKKTRAQLVLKGMSIGVIAMKAIMAGKDADAVIRAVKKAHPKATTGRNSVGWYRSELRRQGFDVPPVVRATEKKAPRKASKKEGKARTAVAPLPESETTRGNGN